MGIKIESQRCAAAVYSPLGNGHRVQSECHFRGKFFEEGKWWCAVHAPSKVKARYDKNLAKWRAQGEADRQRDIDREHEEALEINQLIVQAVRKVKEAHP